jgi:1,4-dihydroxy-2-naphthoate octaprenyltransferase
VFVFLFFGVLAVNGTVWLQTGGSSTLALLASVPVGCLATAILVINNLRDIPTDARAGKRTLAVRIGAAATRGVYLALVAVAFLFPPLLSRLVGPGVLLALGALPLALVEARALGRRTGAELNRSLAGTARLHLVFGLLLAIGLA